MIRINKISTFDLKILDFVAENIRNDFLDKIFPIITFLGNSGGIWVFLGISLAISKKYRKLGIAILSSIIINTLFTNILIKPIVARIRPFDINTTIDLLIKKPLDYSFPSGHTSVSFAAATTIAHSYKRAGLFALILAGLIGISRIYLYVHFPTDVVAGLIIGVGSSFITKYIFKIKNIS